ncbi:lipase maturation factor 2-like isoform X2 [Rhopilema esculentum]
MIKEVDHSRVIQVFLWSVAALFLCAFTSLYTQIPGLYGKDGLYPASYILEDKSLCHDNDRRCSNWSKQSQCFENSEWMLENCAKSCNACKSSFQTYMAFPTLLWHTPYLGLSTETGMEFLCLLGILLSFYMLLSRPNRDCLNYIFLWILYFSLVQVGQIFLYYQWDNLLLEMAFFAALVSPWTFYNGPWNLLKCTRIEVHVQREHDLITFWLVRWLLFRLMFASGIVKLLWMDETWWKLTALNWHYESQCIPTPLAWYMQKLPDSFHRLCVVFTYLIEIVIPFLFFAPVRSIRLFAFCSEVLLQFMILLTGNYNFFNLSTMTLCLSLLDDKFLTSSTDWNKIYQSVRAAFERKKNAEKEKAAEALGQVATDDDKTSNANALKMHVSSTWLLCRRRLFTWLKTEVNPKTILKLQDMLESRPFGILRSVIVAILFLGTVICLFVVAVVYFGLRFEKHEFLYTEIKFTPAWFTKTLTSLLSVAIIVPFVCLIMQIISSALRCLLKDYSIKLKVISLLQTIVFGSFAVWIFGITLVPLTELDLRSRNRIPKIFIRQHKFLEKYKTFNSYGLFRSMTGIGGRPEVVIMGGDSLDQNTTWKEYNFIYKPGNLFFAPPYNVPHQPRLDWQMWFASLGDYMSNPWFVQLTYKLLNGEKAVLDLMSTNPFMEKPPKYIRSVLYRYHYTMNQSGFIDAVFHG